MCWIKEKEASGLHAEKGCDDEWRDGGGCAGVSRWALVLRVKHDVWKHTAPRDQADGGRCKAETYEPDLSLVVIQK